MYIRIFYEIMKFNRNTFTLDTDSVTDDINNNLDD